MADDSKRDFEAGERVVGGILVLELGGELDYGTVAAIEARLERLSRKGHHSLVVDLTRATLLTSSVVNVLFAAVRRARLAGGGISLACADPNVCKAIELTSLDRAAPLCTTVEEAITALPRSGTAG